jgi:hypothetical protein
MLRHVHTIPSNGQGGSYLRGKKSPTCEQLFTVLNASGGSAQARGAGFPTCPTRSTGSSSRT